MDVSFVNYITSQALQAMIFLGESPSPVTGRVEVQLRQAELLLATLRMLREKTTGNLSSEEQAVLDRAIEELTRRYEARNAAEEGGNHVQ